ncbi:MAG: RnfABCDGE type electron transport complex subunit B, partial [Gammaproteobacteria bacterium]
IPVKPLNPAFGTTTPRVRAVIDEALCIGCKKCIDPCPVDAIVGAAKLMHTVIEAHCTGCGLCVPPCPVDCIALVPVSIEGERWPDYRNAETVHWRQLTERRLARRARDKSTPPRRTDAKEAERARIRAEIAAAVARSRAKRSGGRAL